MKTKAKAKEKFNIVLGITGGIAAYKCCELTRLFIKDGHNVKVVMTKNAKEFITPLTMETLSTNKVYYDLFDRDSFSTEHISLSKWGDLLLVAPATANVIGKFSNGIADDILSTLYLSFTKPVLIAPAMHSEMYSHGVVQDNIKKLKSLGVNFIEPESGELASGDWGSGRLPDPETIKRLAYSILTKKNDLKGKRILITAGPTREKLDPVRFISSPSSGKMGIALADEASKRGAQVTLIHGPLNGSTSFKGKKISVITANEMHSEVIKNKNCDIFIGAAAVGDFAPKNPGKRKIKKTGKSLNLELKPNIDVLKNFAKKYGKKKIVVGFAAESNNLLPNAKDKLKRKRLDLIVANDISIKNSGFGSDYNTASLIDREGKAQKLPSMTKRDLANAILDKIIKIKK